MEQNQLKTGAKEKTEQGISSEKFKALEKEFVYPDSLNRKVDLWLDAIRPVSSEEKIFFTQNLGVMLKSGLSASRSFRTLSLQAHNPKFKRALIKITRQVEQGQTIAKAMSDHPGLFSPIFTSMIQAGESSGQLESVLKELTRQLKRSHEIKSKVRGALLYPAAILIAMTGIGTGMIVFVIPKLTSIFSEMGTELPLPTRILIAISNGVNAYLIIIIPVVAIAAGFLFYSTRGGLGQKIWHWLILRLPVVKSISKKINLAKISRTLSSLMVTDMPIVQSLRLTADTIKNAYYRKSLNIMAQMVEKGEAMSKSITQFENLYPPVVQQMVLVGEETGEIANILDQLAQFYEEDVNQTMDSLPSLIEPILIIILGGAVGGMAVAIILPMFSLANAV